MAIFDKIKGKMTGQESIVSGGIVSEIKAKLPGQKSTGTPVIDKVKSFVPTTVQKTASTGPVRKALANVMGTPAPAAAPADTTSTPAAPANDDGTGVGALSRRHLGSMYGDERTQESRRPGLGLGGMFGRDLAGSKMYGKDLQ